MSPAEDFHRDKMRRALFLARKGVGKTSPNPAVGCVVVKDGTVVGEGWHRRAGTPHAEVHALRQAGTHAVGADVYITLEPCAHHGRTPPCAEALIAAGVGRVFIAMIDPDPRVCGRGVAMLRKAGIPVKTALLEHESRQLNEPFIKHAATGQPFVILKCALTLDGKIATSTGDSCWITNEKSRRYVHKLRGVVDGIMVGSGTVLADDPQLTCRINGGKDPLRIVVDSGLSIPETARLFNVCSPTATIVATLSGDPEKVTALQRRGVEVVTCRERQGRIDLEDLLRFLGGRGVQSILLEGGPTLAGEALRAGLVDKVLFFYAPKMIGGDGPGPFAGHGAERIADAVGLKNLTVRKFGDDLLFTGYPERICLPD